MKRKLSQYENMNVFVEGRIKGLENICFEKNASMGWKLFAAKNICGGDVIATIPCSIIHSFTENTLKTPWATILMDLNYKIELITAELLLWIQLWLSREAGDPYLMALDETPPDPQSWKYNDKAWIALVGTNVATTCTLAAKRLEAQFDLIQRTHAKNSTTELGKVTIAGLRWAQGHYLSRRYPGNFKGAKYTNNYNNLPREPDMGRDKDMGCMVPLLCLFNHSHNEVGLDLIVGKRKTNSESKIKSSCNPTSSSSSRSGSCSRGNDGDDVLYICAAQDIKKGNEIYSHYGDLSNEILLRAYGFALKDNPYDTVSLKFQGDDEIHLLRAGGLQGVPSTLWAALHTKLSESKNEAEEEKEENSDGISTIGPDEADALLSWCENWLSSHPLTLPTSATTTIDNSSMEDIRYAFVCFYKEGQYKVVNELAKDLNDMFVADMVDRDEDMDTNHRHSEE
jgi:hypothetical protein